MAAFIFLIQASQFPTQVVQTETLCNYAQEGTFDYIAKLELPNLIYDNRSTLAPGEGIIYLQITEYINTTFTYNFESSLNANTTIQYTIDEYVLTQRWTRKILTIPQQTIVDSSTATNFSVEIPTIEVKSTSSLVSLINSEIGVSTSDYNVTITTNIILNAETESGSISEQFTHTLSIAFLRSTPQGHIISIENLHSARTGKITQSQTIYQDWVRNQQYASYATSGVAIAGLVFCLVSYFRTRSPAMETPPEKLLQEMIEPYEDIIVEASAEPTAHGQTKVTMRSLDDIVTIADTLSKPIIHVKKLSSQVNEEPLHIFYVLDGTTRYEYQITPSEIRATEERILEEEED